MMASFLFLSLALLLGLGVAGVFIWYLMRPNPEGTSHTQSLANAALYRSQIFDLRPRAGKLSHQRAGVATGTRRAERSHVARHSSAGGSANTVKQAGMVERRISRDCVATELRQRVPMAG